MKSSCNFLSIALGAGLLLSACGKMPKNEAELSELTKLIPGDPRNHKHWIAPEDITDFKVLYSQNCQGCHSNGQGVSASIALDNPTYLAWIPKDKLRAVITDGVPGKQMPAFGKKGGGPLTEDQINILVNGFLLNKPATTPAGLPPYEAPLGNPQKGEALLNTIYGPEKAAEWINPSFLALVSNQYLRTLLVIGRPELGQDMSKVHAGAPLSGDEISDVVAWLSSQRPGAVALKPVEAQVAVPVNAAPVTKPKGGL